MAFLDMAVYEKQDFLEYVQSMLTRPQMYASSPGSLEDQVLLLLGLIWDNEGGTLDLIHNRYTMYHYGIFKLGNRPAAASLLATKDLGPGERDDECFKKLAQFLQGFLKYLDENP